MPDTAIPYIGPATIGGYDVANIHPLVGSLCCIFISHVQPMIARNGQRKKTHRDLAARTFFQGAFEYALLSNNNILPRNELDQIDEYHPVGALALFVGGTMIRGGFFASVEYYAQLWSKQNEIPK